MGRARRENGGGERKCKLRQGKVFVDGSHEWGWEGSGDVED